MSLNLLVPFFCPEWIFMCLLTSPLYLKLFLQTEQLKGFSPVWSLMWLMEFPFWENLLPQKEQLKGFSPVWILMWAFRCGLRPNLWPHSEQLNDRSTLQLMSIRVNSWFFMESGPDWGSLFCSQSPSLISVSEESEALSVPACTWLSKSEFLASVFVPLWLRWSWEDWGFSSSSLFTETGLNVNLVIHSCGLRSCSPSWLLQNSSCSSLMCGCSGSCWSRWGPHCCCCSSPTITLRTSDGNTETQTGQILTAD